MKIVVLGAGAWGTALALSASRHPAGHAVELWARDPNQVFALQQARENTRYLPGQHFPQGMTIRHIGTPTLAALGAGLTPDAENVDLCVIGTPMAGLRTMLQAMAGSSLPVAWLCKGFEAPANGAAADALGLMPHEVQAQVASTLKAGALSGPSFAQEVGRGQPTALVAASAHATVREALVAAFHSPTLRVYANDDLVGVEVGGAVKNVLAVATGLCDGLNLGLNARAALITRGLAEMTRLGLALGAKAETFMGLSGLGDLVLTATGDLSRNRRVGLMLAEGRTLSQAVASLGHVAEGVYSARTVLQRARHVGVDMPIVQAVVDLLDGRMLPTATVAALMGRGAKTELQTPAALG
jgi:glycerol-3-phosphate dehydrogenase (NAD(P)+)